MSLGVSKKGRRKLTYNEKQYVWYVQEDNDSPYYCLNIISDDKQLILTLPLGSDIKYVISKGKRFQTNKSNGCWERYVFPLELPEIITPKIVADVINWAEYGNEAVVLEYDGKEFPV